MLVASPVVGHVIAGNTPLLAWTSLLRALLMRSASLVKLPSGDAAEWGRLFQDRWPTSRPPWPRAVELRQWPGGTTELDRTLCESVDWCWPTAATGRCEALRGLCPPGTPLVGYGHRVSFGLLLDGADERGRRAGFATDVLLYDQGGCLSPQTIFVEGDWARTSGFAARLADALPMPSAEYPLPHRAPEAADARPRGPAARPHGAGDARSGKMPPCAGP